MPTVRPAGEEDLPQMLDIYNDIILHTTAVYSYDPHTLDMRRAWFEEKQKQGHPIYVVTADGDRIVGFSSYGPFRPWAAYQFTVENSVYVAEQERGKGIGKLLIPPLIDHARAGSLHAMIASIDASNEASLKLHRSFGFEEVARFREVGFKFGRWLDLSFLELIL